MAGVALRAIQRRLTVIVEVFLEFLGSFLFELPMQLSRFEELCAFREEYDPKRSIGSAS